MFNPRLSLGFPSGLVWDRCDERDRDYRRPVRRLCHSRGYLSRRRFPWRPTAKKKQPLKKDEQNDLDTVLTATLTLLALIIGFSFSMAVSRYDQRKNYEETEANAIGTEYIRADLLPAEDAAKVRELLKLYVDQRIAFHNRDKTASASAGVSGMNDVFNTQAGTQAAWLNRIPIAAWALMLLIAIFSNLLLGYRERSSGHLAPVVLPVISSIAFFLIADIDSPSVGVISVVPQNLILTSEEMKAHR